tara:strand:- start:1963 stop:3747 length:1785 start_codon:yes stop_codon:yes gene_type:complete
MNKIYVIEKYDLLSKLKLFFVGKRKNKFYFHHPYQIDTYEKLKKINDINHIQLDHSTEQELTFQANELIIEYINNKADFGEIENFFEKIGYKKELIIAFQKYYFWKLTKKLRFDLACRYLNKIYSDKYEITAIQDIDVIKFKFDLKGKIIQKIETNYFNLFHKIMIFLVSVSFIPLWLLKDIFVNGISFFSKKQKKFIYGQHLCNNIYNRDDYENNKYTTSRNDFLLHKKIKIELEDSAFVKSSWGFSIEDEKRNKKAIEALNGFLIEERRLSPNIRVISNFLSNYFYFLKYFKNIIFKNNNYNYLVSIIQTLRDTFIIEKFCTQYLIKNFFSRDDFSPLHVARTVVFNKYGLKNNGIAHSIFLEPTTSVLGNFTLFNHYYTQGKIYQKIYSSTWHSYNHSNIGPIYGQLVSEAENNFVKKKSFEKKYGKSFKFLHLTSNFDSNTNPFDSWKINHLNFKKLLDILELDKSAVMFVVFRNSDNVNMYLNSFDNYSKYADRIIIDHSYSTYELMSFCDLMITGSTSSSLFEGTLNPRLSIAPLNVRGIKKNIFNRYKDILVFDNSSELYLYLEKAKNKGFDLKSLRLNNDSISKLL